MKRPRHAQLTRLQTALNAAAELAGAQQQIVDNDESTDAEIFAALDVLERVDNLRMQLNDVSKTLSRKIGAAMQRRELKSVPLDGVGIFERQWHSGTTHYDSDRLVSVVLARALDERRLSDQGEVEREGQTVARVFVDCFGSKPLKTGCRAHGVEPNDFEESATGDRYHDVKITRTHTKG